MLKLMLSLTSPFARKVKVALIEKALPFEEIRVDPWAVPKVLLQANPLSQVPTLVTDTGETLVNSETILTWLERHAPSPPLLPAGNAEAARALAIAGLCQGMIEMTVAIVLERRRAPEQQSAALIERRTQALQRAMAQLENRFHVQRDRFQIDAIGVACALGYLDLRLPEWPWRKSAPRLTDWQAWAAARPSLQASAPPAV